MSRQFRAGQTVRLMRSSLRNRGRWRVQGGPPASGRQRRDATFVVEFTDHLAALGHTDLTVGSYKDATHHFAEWLERSDIALADDDDQAVACFAGHRCKCTGNRRHRHVSAKYVRRVC
jgi:hypothetical protein